MTTIRWRVVGVAFVCALGCGCSSSTGSRTSSTPPRSTDTGAAAVQGYLAAVNTLCDDLLPKVVAVTDGGSFDIPLKDFLAQLPAHTKLRTDFDRQLARVPVPAEAEDEARAMAAYIAFANELDAKRLHAARQGQGAYEREIAAEKQTAVNDPRIAARTAAGFNESCNAR
jgi:hypothetical protein